MSEQEQGALAAAVDRVGDRWSLLLVSALLGGPARFNELQATVAGIAPNILSTRLKQLEAAGVVVASVYSERPQRFAYELTPAGRELAGVLRLLAHWGAVHAGGQDALRHDACGTAAEARWYCPTCERVIDEEVSDLSYV